MNRRTFRLIEDEFGEVEDANSLTSEDECEVITAVELRPGERVLTEQQVEDAIDAATVRDYSDYVDVYKVISILFAEEKS